MDAELARRADQLLLLNPQCTSTAVSAKSAGVSGEEEQPASLLALPDACLMAVLQCCVADAAGPASLFSAARAHSRLQQAAVAALTSISVQQIEQQQQVDGVLLYLDKHGQHVSSVSLRGAGPELTAIRYDQAPSAVHLHQLPSHLQLCSLQLHFLELQLLPYCSGCQGVLGASAGRAALRQLRLSCCALLDGAEGLAAALSLLPGLEHLSICACFSGRQAFIRCLASSWQQQQQLTYLELDRVVSLGPDWTSPTLQQALQGLTRLADLRLSVGGPLRDGITASALSGMSQLTRLDVFSRSVEPTALAGKTQLRHLQLRSCSAPADLHGGWLKQLQQLTYLDLCDSLDYVPTTPAAAYSALTASSKLRHLDIGKNTVPPDVWQHVFPAGRQLPHLTSLVLMCVRLPQPPRQLWRNFAAAPNGSLIVSCCPALQSLDMRNLECTEEELAPLQQLSMLTTLRVDIDPDADDWWKIGYILFIEGGGGEGGEGGGGGGGGGGPV